MIVITTIIFLTVILIVAIIKEHKLSNSNDLSRIETELRQLRSELEINNRILGNLADSILYLPKRGISPKGTCDTSWCENEL